MSPTIPSHQAMVEAIFRKVHYMVVPYVDGRYLVHGCAWIFPNHASATMQAAAMVRERMIRSVGEDSNGQAESPERLIKVIETVARRIVRPGARIPGAPPQFIVGFPGEWERPGGTKGAAYELAQGLVRRRMMQRTGISVYTRLP